MSVITRMKGALMERILQSLMPISWGTLCETSKFLDIAPRRYLRAAVGAALDGIRIPLPHEI